MRSMRWVCSRKGKTDKALANTGLIRYAKLLSNLCFQNLAERGEGRHAEGKARMTEAGSKPVARQLSNEDDASLVLD